ncbi:SAM-dependent methyltransferase [Verrucomicrobium sp. GAS474]|uniref:class I SAM-dependent rRNA methyltransferase n=1 Tax=Verrucomicrobium sp. GAS474 TaxID=1882831 RepID=UPI00087BCE61|nr:class I SAM-dependent rRNA methyltransferase [Verrucomicrobium sp. GAS474]SDU00540.1 SAM-dependent methyltransferase [Verrucomicrobium sp. GAS474]
MSRPALYLNEATRHRIRDGHPWVFRSEVARVEDGAVDGGTVRIIDTKGRPLGSGIYNSKSQIVVRRYSLRDEELDSAFLSRALDAALALRKRLPARNAQRLVWSESDGLPGLILDQYGTGEEAVLVLQTVTAAMARLQPEIVALAAEKTGAKTILARNDIAVRTLEGLPREQGALLGSYAPPTRLNILGVDLDLDLLAGQKTGLYLDQLDNHAAVLPYAKGKRILDCFCNQGLFALAARKAGAVSCDALDQSAEELGRGKAAAARENLEINWIEANAFDWLREAERRKGRYDMIVLDPPSFTKTKDQVSSALRGYHELHLRALRMIGPGGLLATYCCSHHLTRELWHTMLQGAAKDAGCTLRLVSTLGQGGDHPVLLHIPETEYLKGFLVEKI